ncbi:SDR family oxidoreductase [Tessaracoccus antarcticus]|uniref:SDR family oxidoreductase n=1 Tax=Tessaracoccus antarcticus TaxID=2479848 RepID=A0A3M0G8E5_9ACTN|nr:SDR family oxidoreductase [Tessaracoccus antarcticus]RMB61311.1 SDR family oxidoreductase [Tessaracoccus antarcticus]
MRIVIIGGHGQVALLAAPLLVRGGHRVTSVVRNPDHVAEVEGTGAKALVSDVEQADEAELRRLVAGGDAVIWAAGAGAGIPQRTYAVDRDAAIRTIDASVAEGVGRFVMLSYVGSGRDNVPADNPFHAYADAKAVADEYLRGTSLNWTILGPCQLTDDPKSGRIQYGDEVSGGRVSRGNVAELLVGVVGRTDLAGVTIRFRDGRTGVWEAMESLARRAAGRPFAPRREGYRMAPEPERSGLPHRSVRQLGVE